MPKAAYALVGEDSFLQLQMLAGVMREMPEGAQRSDYDGETATLADVLDELRSFAMFGGGYKLVTIRNADPFVTRYRESLEDYLAAPSTSASLLLRLGSLPGTTRIAKIIQKIGRIELCEPPKDLAKWAITHAKTVHRAAFTPDAARLLVEQVGSVLGRLDMEIAKLAINADGGTITVEHVSDMVAFTRDREMKDLTSAVAAGDTAEALRRWRQLIQSDPASEFRAVTWLGLWLGDVNLVLTEGRRSPAVQKLFWKYKGDAFKRFCDNCEKLGRAGYARAVDLLAEIDKQSKSGVGDAAENVERFILTMAQTS
jgi:DNA polymerase-3 subunit delta